MDFRQCGSSNCSREIPSGGTILIDGRVPDARAVGGGGGILPEAWRKRRYPAAFVAKLSDAESEAAETQTWVEFARRVPATSHRKTPTTLI